MKPACSWRCQSLEGENRRLQEQNAQLLHENRHLQKQNAHLQRENSRLADEVSRLKGLLEKERRAGKRQAAPFSKGKPKANPKPPGRRPGDLYGRAAHRAPPVRIDEVIEAPLAERCPYCSGAIHETSVAPQFHVDIPPVVAHVTQFNVHIGTCSVCGRRLQGRHQRQTSDALGAAASQIGPRALALATELHKGLGLSLGKAQRLFETAFDIEITRGGISQALHRVARVTEPTYNALTAWIQKDAPVVSPDETGWKVGGELHWLWAFATPHAVVYSILPGRGFEQAAQILGENFDGTLARDGLAIYRSFRKATHQSCLAHLLRRCRENLETAQRGEARVPRAVKDILATALALRDLHEQRLIRSDTLASARALIEARMDRLLTWHPRDEENRKLLKHLRGERTALFTFLDQPQVPATNWWSEQAIRPAVVNRKVWGGNRTWRGASTQQVLVSLLQTCGYKNATPLKFWSVYSAHPSRPWQPC